MKIHDHQVPHLSTAANKQATVNAVAETLNFYMSLQALSKQRYSVVVSA